VTDVRPSRPRQIIRIAYMSTSKSDWPRKELVHFLVARDERDPLAAAENWCGRTNVVFVRARVLTRGLDTFAALAEVKRLKRERADRGR